MNRARGLIVLLIAISAGLVFACGTYKYVQKQPTHTTSMPTRSVVVAAADLDVGATITRDDVKVIDWPTTALPANSMSNPSEVIGRGLLLPMLQHEPFLPMKMAAKDAGGGRRPALT